MDVTAIVKTASGWLGQVVPSTALEKNRMETAPAGKVGVFEMTSASRRRGTMDSSGEESPSIF